jgi:tetratricopeptide (TPR) repeat protein
MLDDPYMLQDKARGALLRGDVDAAIAALVAAAGHTYLTEQEYARILRPLEQAFGQRGDWRSALAVLAYLGPTDAGAYRRAEPLLARVPPADRAPILAAQGRMAEAAREMEEAGQVASAAIYREKARDWSAARALWSRLASRITTRLAPVMAGGEDAYVTALVRFNLARCARQCGDAVQARGAIVASVRLLEEAADHFESVGRRERAFDCFQVLVQIGRESGAFEDVLEGFVNSIRILQEDHLRYDFALELFDEAIAAATERDETRAAATLAGQASEYARALGLTAAASEYALRQAHLWRAVAKLQQGRGAPAPVVENALLAAVSSFGEIGQYASAREIYAELAQLPLDPSRREHYGRAATRYANVKDEPLGKSSARARPAGLEAHQTEVWHVDVLEWERRGSASAACADVLFDQRWVDLIRRKAMLALFAALDVDRPAARGPAPGKAGAPSAASTGMASDTTPDAALRDRLVVLAGQLGQVQLYVMLSPLEALFETPDRAVRIAVLKSLQSLSFKRSFVTVRAALLDPDPAIVDQAARTVEALTFAHAVDPLARILREAPQPDVRASALRALARVDTPEAADLVIGVLEHGGPADRAAAVAAVRGGRGTAVTEAASAALARASGELRATLQAALAGVGRGS